MEDSKEEEVDASRVLALFLENEARYMLDMVNDVLQSHYLISIADSIWGSDDSRNFVYLQLFNDIPLSKRDTYDFIHKFPNNRLVLFSVGKKLSESVREGNLTPKGVQDYFHEIVKFVTRLLVTQMELVYT